MGTRLIIQSPSRWGFAEVYQNFTVAYKNESCRGRRIEKKIIIILFYSPWLRSQGVIPPPLSSPPPLCKMARRVTIDMSKIYPTLLHWPVGVATYKLDGPQVEWEAGVKTLYISLSPFLLGSVAPLSSGQLDGTRKLWRGKMNMYSIALWESREERRKFHNTINNCFNNFFSFQRFSHLWSTF